VPWDTALPYGARDTKITAYTSDAATTLAGSSTDVPNARTISFEEAEEFTELRGDDKVVAIHGSGPSVNWEMEHGGINIPAYKLMAGGTTATSGTTPAQVTTYTKKVTDTRPYFKAEGQAISDLGGDFHVVLPRCKTNDTLSGELADGEFWLTGASGQALPSLVVAEVDVLYKFILNETAVAIT
jgi:hypothetical protein